MRRVSLKHKPLVDAGNANAAQLIAECNGCEWCSRPYGGLECHEIVGGNALRRKARVTRFAVLCLCRECHAQIGRMPMPERVLIGLAILWHSRPQDYSLPSFIELVCPHAPRRYLPYEVELWTRRLLRQGSER
jgi:hypothetical protein